MKKIDELRSVLEGREEGYGGSADTLNRIALLWGAYLSMRTGMEFELGPDAVAELMVLLKIARSAGLDTDSSRDDRLDMAGYAILNAEIQDGAKTEEAKPSTGFQMREES